MPGLRNVPESMSIALHARPWIVDDPRAFRPSPVIAKAPTSARRRGVPVSAATT